MDKASQIGGDHYAAQYQHWDWAIDVKLPYLESAATKYLCRWWNKNGIQDLEKSVSYMLKAQECYFAGRHHNTSFLNRRDTCSWALLKSNEFLSSAKIPKKEASLIMLIAEWHDTPSLKWVIAELRSAVEAAQAWQAAGGTLGPLATLSGTGGGATASSGGNGAKGGTGHPAPFGYQGDE